MIHAYGAPNGLCSSMMEKKHIKAIKKPWRWTSHYKATKQMLLTNQHLEGLSASHIHFQANSMLEGDCLITALEEYSSHIHNKVT